LFAAVLALAVPASAAEFNLVAWYGTYDATAGLTLYEPLPMGPGGNQTIFQYNPEPLTYCPPEHVEIIIMISTDKPGAGVNGMDLMDGNTLPYASGVWSGLPGAPDPWVGIHQLNNLIAASVDTEADAITWSGFPPYTATDDTWFFSPWVANIGGYVETPPGPGCTDGYQAGAVSYPIGTACDPDYGNTAFYPDGVPFMHLVLNKEEIPCGEMTSVMIAGLGGLCEAAPERPTSWHFLGTDWGDIPAGEVPYGFIDIICIPEPASLALLALGLLLLRRRK
jgi:hypothetical protein